MVCVQNLIFMHWLTYHEPIRNHLMYITEVNTLTRT